MTPEIIKANLVFLTRTETMHAKEVQAYINVVQALNDLLEKLEKVAEPKKEEVKSEPKKEQFNNNKKK